MDTKDSAEGGRTIPLSSPDISEADIDAVVEVLRTPNLSLGPKLPEFESKFALFMGSRHAVAVNSGTSALHLCIRAMGIGPGDEVITSPFSFIASANCILFEGARPVFVDIDKATWNIDVSLIEAAITERTKAILPVHVFGRPVDLEPLLAIAEKHSLVVLEDSCEAIGATYKGRKVGTLGRCGTFAFYPNKQMTTGEGGMIISDDDETADLCKSMRNQGRATGGGGWLAHARLGYNYRLSDINCALGITQLARIPEFLEMRQTAAERYLEKLADIEEIIPPAPYTEGTMSWFVFVVRLADRFSQSHRDSLLDFLHARGVGCNNYFTPIHLQPFYVEQFGFAEGDSPVTDLVSQRTIALPFFNRLSEDDQDYAIAALKDGLARL
ncbi:MAG: DegT/DnrJ/EryC1/StrS family aminotransferase [Phycisphaerae bacterium]|nr:DegT/DnrJ/EryC1/StrS family aminotransferase [Phycisphaerae bacterium]